jgi:transcription termination factor Rho
MTPSDGAHLADLHARAAELGVARYRLMRRADLERAIEDARSGDAGPGRERSRRDRPPRDRRGGGRQRERLRDTGAGTRGDRRQEAEADGVGEEVTGVLEVTPQRFGFLRLSGLDEGPDDVYISASQVRRCELRPGDEVTGPARPPRRGERHRALVHVDRVNGAEPQAERPRFDDLTPVVARRRIPLDGDGSVLVRAVDLLAPLALGQRILVEAAPRSGRTTLLREIAGALSGVASTQVIVLLVDERPEELTAWREALPGAEIAAAGADLAPAEQVAVAKLALERTRRRAEAGADAVLIVDSLSRLAVAADDVALVKRLFGSGRDLAEEQAGSVTVVATVLEGAEDDGAAERAVVTTENSLIALDVDLAARGVSPALAPGRCRASNEDDLREPSELEAARRLRSLLADLPAEEAAGLLRERIEGTATNAELLGAI